ncbi:MAG: tyrosine-type recombinase/integrase [Myxococcota bacterium]
MFKVSVAEEAGDRFKLRWREYRPVLGEGGAPLLKPDGKPVLKASARAVRVQGKKARDETKADIIAALRNKGFWDPPTAPPVVAGPTICNLEVAAAKWVEFKRTRCSSVSVQRFVQHMARWFRTMRQVRGIAAKAVVPADVLDRDTFIACVRALQDEKLSASTVYGIARSALEMWRWASDDPRAYPGVVTPPREGKAVLPRGPVYMAPTAPTIAELDACLRHISANAPTSRRVGVILRFTGLRISQVLALRREDIDLAEGTITVRTGRSAQERNEARCIPVSQQLHTALREWVIAVPTGAVVIAPSRARGREGAATKRRSETFRTAWERATAAGEARERAWKPVNRARARPEHAFRAALQAFWRRQGVDEVVIDALVGHHPTSTREKHYAGPEELMDQMKEAVALLPAIDWVGPKGEGKVEQVR